jgi:hypothetical protein
MYILLFASNWKHLLLDLEVLAGKLMLVVAETGSNSHYGNCSHIFDRKNGWRTDSVVDNCAVAWLVNA